MDDHQHRAGRQIGCGRGDQGHGVLTRLAGGFEHHHAFLGEQRRAQQLGELAGAHLAGPHPVHRDVVGPGLLTQRPQHRPHGSFDQQFLIAQNQVQTVDLFAHTDDRVTPT